MFFRASNNLSVCSASLLQYNDYCLYPRTDPSSNIRVFLIHDHCPCLNVVLITPNCVIPSVYSYTEISFSNFISVTVVETLQHLLIMAVIIMACSFRLTTLRSYNRYRPLQFPLYPFQTTIFASSSKPYFNAVYTIT